MKTQKINNKSNDIRVTYYLQTATVSSNNFATNCSDYCGVISYN